MNQNITDLWFYSRIPLLRVAASLGATDPASDAEDHWAWVICSFRGARLDITRAVRAGADRVPTRVFRLDNAPFDDDLRRELVRGLLPIALGTVYCGRWEYRGGNDHDMIVVERLVAPMP
jgi:hypothetical protein